MALFERAIQRGLHADRPAPGAPGACYFETDTGNGYRDSGTTWDLITSAIGSLIPPLAIHTANENYTIPTAGVLIIIGTADIVITLPSIVDSTGLLVGVVTPGNAYAVHNPDGSDAPQSGFSPALYISDGVAWRSLFGAWA